MVPSFPKPEAYKLDRFQKIFGLAWRLSSDFSHLTEQNCVRFSAFSGVWASGFQTFTVFLFCRQLCLGSKGYGYKGSKIFRGLPNNHIVAGDFEHNNGSGGHSAMEGAKHFLAEHCPLSDQKCKNFFSSY